MDVRAAVPPTQTPYLAPVVLSHHVVAKGGLLVSLDVHEVMEQLCFSATQHANTTGVRQRYPQHVVECFVNGGL